ncbi:uncharacterized protein [Atheta coriaria]|uniref:uncharacterized protein isoform X5 n=1 Tax=Dalotia coriaria TaxID=877792 RepID=UPI0031F3FBF3
MSANGSDHEHKRLTEAQKTAYINRIFDVILFELGMFMLNYGFDPLKLPDQVQTFSYKPLLVNYTGVLNLTKGVAYNVSDIQRNGDVQMKYLDRILTLSVPLKLNKIHFKYDYDAKIMNLGPKGGVEGNAVNIEVFASLTINFKEMHITMNECANVVKIGKISVSFTGNAPTDWLINLLTPLVVVLFRGMINDVITDQVCKNAVELFDEINAFFISLKPESV